MQDINSVVAGVGNAPLVRRETIRNSRCALTDAIKMIARARLPLTEVLNYSEEEIKILNALHDVKIRIKNIDRRLGKLS